MSLLQTYDPLATEEQIEDFKTRARILRINYNNHTYKVSDSILKIMNLTHLEWLDSVSYTKQEFLDLTMELRTQFNIRLARSWIEFAKLSVRGNIKLSELQDL